MIHPKLLKMYQALLIGFSVYSEKFLGVKGLVPLNIPEIIDLPIPVDPGVLVGYGTGRIIRHTQLTDKGELGLKEVCSGLTKAAIGDSVLIAQYLYASNDKIDFWFRMLQVFSIIMTANTAVIGAALILGKENKPGLNIGAGLTAGIATSDSFEKM